MDLETPLILGNPENYNAKISRFFCNILDVKILTCKFRQISAFLDYNRGHFASSNIMDLPKFNIKAAIKLTNLGEFYPSHRGLLEHSNIIRHPN